jgi:hypothetical protein
VRGGSYTAIEGALACDYNGGVLRLSTSAQVGFRCRAR